jgi:hypothetical protein
MGNWKKNIANLKKLLNLKKAVRYNREKTYKMLITNQSFNFVRYIREFVLTEFVITEFDCMLNKTSFVQSSEF